MQTSSYAAVTPTSRGHPPSASEARRITGNNIMTDIENVSCDEPSHMPAENIVGEESTAWQCTTCTFVNENPLHLSCSVCGTDKMTTQTSQEEESDKLPGKLELIEDDEAPVSFQVNATNETNYDNNINAAKERPEVIDSDDTPPLQAEQIAQLHDGVAENANKKLPDFTMSPDQEHPPEQSTQTHIHSTAGYTSPATRVEHEETLPNTNQDLEEIVILPPPPSMLPRPETDDPSIPSYPLLVATPVPDDPTAPPLYYAEAVQTCDFWKRYKKYIAVGIVSLLVGGMAATIGMLVSSPGSGNEDGDVVPYPQTTVYSSYLYYADTENERCIYDTEGLASSYLRPRSFMTLEECCQKEFGYLNKNECMTRSQDIAQGSTTVPIQNSTTSSSSKEPATIQEDLDNNTFSHHSTTTSTSSSISTKSTLPIPNTQSTLMSKSSTTQSTPITVPTTTPRLPNTPALIPSIPNTPATPASITKSSPAPMIWKQLGQSIVGEAAGDQMGDAVSLSGDGMTLAIGARWNDGNGFVSGHVRVFHKEAVDPSWTQLGQDIDGENDQDLAGNSVALTADGKTLAIGAPGYWQAVDRPGYAKVYHLEGTGGSSVWKQVGETIRGGANRDWCGYGVDLSSDGKILAMGCPGFYQNTDRPGYARVYQIVDDQDDWKQLGEDIIGSSNGDRAGTTLSLAADGKTLAIGASNNDDGGDQAGNVIVLRYDETSSSWSHNLVNYIIGGKGGDKFAASVALSADGKTLAAGAIGLHGENKIPGYVKTYHTSDNGLSWKQHFQKIEAEALGDRFGISVGLSNDGHTLAVGASNNAGNGVLAGHVRVYHTEGPDSSWVQVGDDIDGVTSGEQSDWALALSGEDGKTVAISSITSDANGETNGENSGQVRVFSLE